MLKTGEERTEISHYKTKSRMMPGCHIMEIQKSREREKTEVGKTWRWDPREMIKWKAAMVLMQL